MMPKFLKDLFADLDKPDADGGIKKMFGMEEEALRPSRRPRRLAEEKAPAAEDEA